MIEVDKYHGNGNDFLVLLAHQVDPEDYAAFSKSICEPHFGMGADGCVFLTPLSARDIRIRIFNRDGSEAGMSGNGVRCAGAFVHRRHLSGERELLLETRSGTQSCVLLGERDLIWEYRLRLPPPSFSPPRIPCQAGPKLESIEDFCLQLGPDQVRIHALRVGNPQCVVFVDDLPAEAVFRRLGPALERHPFFPHRTNVSFARVDGSHRMKIRIWERGVGPTCSSGTGACGAAVAAIRSGRTASPVRVATDTGEQEVQWSPGQPILLTGEASFVAASHFKWRPESVVVPVAQAD
ncbi:MAG: diaminopimelate epimerase [Acidobacteriota bacterium]